MVAGFIAGQVQGLSLPDCARLATAFSLGAITSAGHNLPAPHVLQAYFRQVSLHTLVDVPRSVSL
jgi:1-phosphofructokinase